MDILRALRALNGYWKYDGGRYLAKLTSGEVSDVYCNLSVLTSRPRELSQAVMGLMFDAPFVRDEAIGAFMKFSVQDNMQPLYVCGPAMGGVTLAYEVARQIGGSAIFTEPAYGVHDDWYELAGNGECMCNDSHSGMVEKIGQQLKRFKLPQNITILFVEDVITTGKSTYEMIKAVRDASPNGVQLLPYVLCLVNRSGKTHTASPFHYPDDIPIISLAEINARTWDDEFEATEEILKTYEPWNETLNGYVRDGVVFEAVRPKDNWGLLTGGA